MGKCIQKHLLRFPLLGKFTHEGEAVYIEFFKLF